MIASINDYLYSWHWILLMVFLAGWLLGGGWLMARGLKKILATRRPQMGRGVLLALLSGGAGAVGAAVIFIFFRQIGQVIKSDHLIIPGAVVALLTGLALAYLVVFAMQSLTARQTGKLVALPMASILALSAVIAGTAGPYSYNLTQERRGQDDCSRNLRYIQYYLKSYSRTNLMPQTLQVLVDRKQIKAEQLFCPARADEKRGYFYMARDLKKQQADTTIVLCDLHENHKNGRCVIMADWSTAWLTEQEFQELLKLPVNAEFADALKSYQTK